MFNRALIDKTEAECEGSRPARRTAEAADTGFITERIETRQVEILDNACLSASANIPAVLLTGFIIRNAVPAIWLSLWAAVMIAVVTGLIISVRGAPPWRGNPDRAKVSPERRLVVHRRYAIAIGAVWGVACIAFNPSLTPGQLMFLTVIVMGCNAACIAALGPYLPAFFGYFLASLVPLLIVNLTRTEVGADLMTLLLVLYMATVTINVHSHSRHVLAAFRLRAENEALARNLVRADAATAEATHSKWSALAHLSHELRTPMNAILGFSELMSGELFGPLGERYKAYADHINESGRHALDLINAIFEVSGAEVGQLTLNESAVAPEALVDECLHMVELAAARKQVALASRIDNEMPCFAADRPKLRQALLNLLTNAIKYTPEGGSVSVAAGLVDGGLDIAVADTGVGIADGDLDRCLEPFVRLRNPLTAGVEGAGLGLPLAKHLVEAHGGSLRIASKPGQGTIVTIHVPLQRRLAA